MHIFMMKLDIRQDVFINPKSNRLLLPIMHLLFIIGLYHLIYSAKTIYPRGGILKFTICGRKCDNQNSYNHPLQIVASTHLGSMNRSNLSYAFSIKEMHSLELERYQSRSYRFSPSNSVVKIMQLIILINGTKTCG